MHGAVNCTYPSIACDSNTSYTICCKVLEATPAMNVFWQTVNRCASSHQGVDPKCSKVRIKTYWHLVTCIDRIIICQ
jgi:hypothetical protein